MANHAATQEANPARATWRTVFQVGVPALVGFVLILPELLQLVLNEVGEVLPEGFRLWLTGAVVVVTAFAGLLARLMANPALNDWLRRHFRALAPDHQPPSDTGAH